MSNLLNKKLVDIVTISEPTSLVFKFKFMNDKFGNYEFNELTSYVVRDSELIKKYNELSQKTGLSLYECKLAYEQAESDMDKAVLILEALVSKRSY